jgi:5-methylcytosine-specific restriction endonuclease McrA
MRKEFSYKTKVLAARRSLGICECGCGGPLMPGKIQYDHVIPCGLGGDNSLDNCAVLTTGHHADKTAIDIDRIAKARRLEYKRFGIKKPRRITAWRRFNGEIVRKGRER